MNWQYILKEEDEDGSYSSPTITEDEKELKEIDEATKSLLAIIKDSNNLRSIWPRTQNTITMLEQLREALKEKQFQGNIDRMFPHWKQTGMTWEEYFEEVRE
tara:strand:- start:1995 stop:2300 length:306 start_codon:yes stop_codon:yes gene_type:complete